MSRYFKLNNIRLLFLTIWRVKNWPIFILDLFNLVDKDSIIYEMRNGFKYYARAKTSDRGIINTVIIQDEYELDKLDLRHGTIIDLGGQNGYFSVAASKYADRVYTFEPTQDNYKIILKNININQLDGKIHPFNMAVSDKKSPIKIFMSKNTGGHSVYGSGDEFIKADTTTLPEIFEKHNIDRCDLLKIDIEGSEYDIFYNLPQEYFKKIFKIRMEAHEIDSDKKNPKYLIKFLETNGYKVSYKWPILFAKRS